MPNLGPRATPQDERVYEPPTDEQLVNFVAVLAFGPCASIADKAIVKHALAVDIIKQGWLDRHRAMQEATWEI